MPDTINKNGHGSALDKAIAVLEQITAQPQAIGLPDLAARLGMPRQTLHRILQQLERLGLILRDPTRERFFVGPRLSSLAIAALFSDNHHQPTRRILQALVEDIGESCNIGALDGIEFVYLDRIQTDRSLRIHLEVGSRVPAYCSSGGKILLAHLPEPARHRIVRSRPLKAHTRNTITDPDALETELNACRQRGYSTNSEEFTDGIVGVAAPVLAGGDRAIAAVACHAPAARVALDELERVVPKLQESARALAHCWT